MGAIGLSTWAEGALDCSPYEMYKPKGVLLKGIVQSEEVCLEALYMSQRKQHNKIATLRLGITRPDFDILFHDLEAV